MRIILTILLICIAGFVTTCSPAFADSNYHEFEGIKTPTPLPTGTATPMAVVDIAVTTPTITERPRLSENPTLRPCDYYFAQWGRKRAKGTEADPFPVNKLISGKVNCRLWGEEVNRVVNGR